MLQNIRDNAKGWLAWVIITIICVPFALWGIHEYLNPSQSVVLAEVNDVQISPTDFRQAFQQRRDQLRAMFKNPNMDLSFMDAQLRQDTLKQLIDEALLLQAASNWDMRIGDALLATHIHNYPVFQQDGKFDQTRYEQLLRSQGYSPLSFESEVRRDLLSAQLRNGVSQTAFLTEAETQHNAELQNQERQISYLLISASKAASVVDLSKDEIEQYYNDNPQQYQTDEKVSIEYVELTLDGLLAKQTVDEVTLQQHYQERIANYSTPTEWKARHILIALAENADATTAVEAEQKTKTVYERLKNGEDFSTLAKEFSDDTDTKDNGGLLEWFAAGSDRYPAAIADTIAGLEEGQLSEPVKGQFGYHIIRLDEKKPELVKTFDEVRASLEADLKREAGESEFYGQAEQFANLAFEHPDSLDSLASTMQLEKKTTGFFTQAGTPDNEADKAILAERKLIDAAFSEAVLKNHFNSEVIELDNNHVVVLRVLEHQASQLKPLAEVQTAIETALVDQRQQAAAKALAKTLLDELKQNKEPNALAAAHQLSWSPSQWVKRSDRLEGEAALVQTAFKSVLATDAAQASYQQVALSNGDYALLAVLGVRADVGDISEPKPPASAFGDTQFNAMVAALKANADIKVYEKNME